MNRAQLEHIIRAAGAITLQRHFIIIGSQSVLGSHPSAPTELLRSMDLDLYPRESPDAAIVIDGAIGEGSMFHQTFGYYAHGVGPETAKLPPGWQDRLVEVHNENTGGSTGWCLDPSDLAISKLVAGRPNDKDFVQQMISHDMVQVDVLLERLRETDCDATMRKQAMTWLSR